MARDQTAVRTCIGCGRRAPQHELVRLALQSDGFVVIGPTLEGRGAWLCQDSPPCLAEATKRTTFARAFRSPISGVLVTEDDLRSEPPKY